MIVGTGMLARVFGDMSEDESTVIFASGVSNSQETNPIAFEREQRLLSETIKKYKNKKIIYFSTCSIYDPDLDRSPYVMHKLEMEKLISSSCLNYNVFRLSQVVGNTSSPTIINFFYNKIVTGEEFLVWKNSRRNLIDVENVRSLVIEIISKDSVKNSITNIASPYSFSAIDIVKSLEVATGVSAIYRCIPTGSSYLIDLSDLKKYVPSFESYFQDSQYPHNVIMKYYSNKKEK